MWHLLKDMRKKDKGLAFLAVLLIAGQVFLDLKLPDYTKEITVLISSESNTISDYLLSGGKMLACALGSALLAVIVGYLAAKIAADFSHNVRGKGFSPRRLLGGHGPSVGLDGTDPYSGPGEGRPAATSRSSADHCTSCRSSRRRSFAR